MPHGVDGSDCEFYIPTHSWGIDSQEPPSSPLEQIPDSYLRNTPVQILWFQMTVDLSHARRCVA